MELYAELNQYKRVKERNIQEVREKVTLWRQLFREGEYDEEGYHHKLSLHEAAERVGIPKKTLEDYE